MLLGNGLTLLPLSPAFGKGIDPSTLPGLPPEIVADLKKYIYVDINGTPRPQNGAETWGLRDALLALTMLVFSSHSARHR